MPVTLAPRRGAITQTISRIASVSGSQTDPPKNLRKDEWPCIRMRRWRVEWGSSSTHGPNRCITSCSPMPACRSHLPFSRWREPCCCRGLELRSRFTVQGCIGAAQQMSYHLDHSVGADRPRRRTAQGGHLRERRQCRNPQRPTGVALAIRPFCPHGPVPSQALPRGALFLCLLALSSCGFQQP
jgi:hypothetical protein